MISKDLSSTKEVRSYLVKNPGSIAYLLGARVRFTFEGCSFYVSDPTLLDWRPVVARTPDEDYVLFNDLIKGLKWRITDD